ncbi:general transcription factor II-I repeat domain-containing protein 2-like [Rhodnius prolixus]|uniref:general transcription factor II-I repeat domain-containing protein 2-like n=1 Tax=Rhodnius prolixus TaxID=13249 RepID=UPI003D18E8BA
MKDKCVCFICNATVALPKKANVERHFLTVHKNYEEDYPRGTALRKAKIQQLKAQLTAQQNSFFKCNTNSKTATIASFKVTDTLIKHNKPFHDGEVWKEAFIKAGEVLFQNFKNKSEIMASIKNMSLSRNTVMRRTEGISQNLEDILHENINKCIVLSLQFDESTDYIGTAQLCIFIRMVFDDMSATEELLTIIPMHERTRGQDIFDLFKNYVARTNFPICKLASITTDGAPAMIGNKSGFVALCKRDDDIPNFMDYHCIIHTQVLCSKVLKFDHVMDVAFKIVNSIRSKSLSRRQFRALLKECGDEHSELLLHTDVRWLSRATFLTRFRELLPQFTHIYNAHIYKLKAIHIHN